MRSLASNCCESSFKGVESWVSELGLMALDGWAGWRSALLGIGLILTLFISTKSKAERSPPLTCSNSIPFTAAGSDPSKAQADAISIDGKRLGFTECPQPGNVPWHEFDVDIVVECSGKFVTAASLQPYFDAGVRKVIVAAPVKEHALNVVMGCNDRQYNPESTIS